MRTPLASASTVAICFTLAACSSTSTVKPMAAESAPAIVTTSAQPAATPVATESEAQRFARIQAELAKKSVYFDFDNYTLKPQYQDIVHGNADFMSRNGTDAVILEGNADERGSKEYNLSLGQKRSDAVKRSLILLGAKEDQVESVSLGEEKPKNPGHEESAWADNRRADILYKAPDGRGEF